MKKYKILTFFFAFALIISSCEDTFENRVESRDVAVVPGIQNLNPATYDVNDLENTFIQFDLTLPRASVSEAALLVSFGNEKQREVVTSVTTFPANIKVSLTDVVAALGMNLEDIEPADQFSFEVRTIEGGETYFSSANFKVAVVCGYEADIVTGDYLVYSAPAPVGWDMEANVTLEADPDDEFKVYINGYATAEGLVETGPIVMIINPLNFSVTVPASKIADNAFGYTGYTYTGSGSLNTCNGKYELMLSVTVDQGGFGTFPFEFTKQ